MCTPWYDTVGAIVGVIVLLIVAFTLGMWFVGTLIIDKPKDKAVYISNVEDAIRFVEHNISFNKSCGDHEDAIESLENVLKCLQALYNALDSP